jgi:hypothetical protein
MPNIKPLLNKILNFFYGDLNVRFGERKMLKAFKKVLDKSGAEVQASTFVILLNFGA